MTYKPFPVGGAVQLYGADGLPVSVGSGLSLGGGILSAPPSQVGTAAQLYGADGTPVNIGSGLSLAGGTLTAPTPSYSAPSTTTTASFVQPAAFATVTVSVASVSGFRAGQIVVVDGGAYAICSIGSSSFVLLNLAYSFGLAIGATIASGSSLVGYTPSGIAAAMTLANFSGTVPLDLWSLVSQMILDNKIASESAFKETHGGTFTVMADGMSCTGIRLWSSVSRSVKVSLWDAGGTRVATATATVSGVSRIRFATPYALTRGQSYTYGAWITDQSVPRGVAVSSTGVAPPSQVAQPFIQITASRLYYSVSGGDQGDGRPTTVATGESYFVEPIFF